MYCGGWTLIHIIHWLKYISEKFKYNKVDENTIEYFIKEEYICKAIHNFKIIMNTEENRKLVDKRR